MAKAVHLLCACLVLSLALASAQRVSGHGSVKMRGAVDPKDDEDWDMPEYSGSNGAQTQLAGVAGNGAPAPAPPVVEKKGFSGMYFGILVTFVILWTIYFFLYFFEYGGIGTYSFFLSSYVTLFILISLGLSSYFTPSVLTGLLVSSLFIVIASSGFGAMGSISSPDRFEGDKHNMGRTRLE